ncbi:hypothetical protein ACFOZ1_08790 [Gracilibacillus marinus]|uniref:Uncharacterized protein n=1 Tax=Gracilibacillus marinus TaxID=630535 RepID=A0ABV8VTX9_9BACI
MKKIVILLIFALLVFTLSACDENNSEANTNASKDNTISVVELTERENAILATTTDQAFIFDFNIDDEYKNASVWVEKYEFGKFVDDEMGQLTTQVEKNGSIVVAIPKIGDNQQFNFNVGISSEGSTGSISGFDANSNELENMLNVSASFQEKSTSIEDEVVLASICYSDSNGMNSLTSDFYKDVEGHMDELKAYNVVYLIKAEFME